MASGIGIRAIGRRGWFATAALVVAGASLVAQDTPPKGKPQDDKEPPKRQEIKPAEEAKVARIGEPAPAIALRDLDDKEHKLADHKGKVVVLEWFSPDCPVVRMHYEAKTFEMLRKKFKDLDVVFLAIHSTPTATQPAPADPASPNGSQGDAAQRCRDRIAEWKFPDVLLLDRDGKVAKAYGAKVTPEMMVVDAEGRLAYRGAIDDGSTTAPGKVNWVELAVSNLLAKQKVATPETTAYGCPIRF